MMNKLKPALAAALAAAMLTGTAFAAPIYAAAPPIFSDVPTKHWGYQFVQRAAQEKLVTGTGNGKFAPESTVSTAEWATMICALMYPDAAAKQPAGDEWWSPYVSALVENDVLVGTNTYIATRTWAASDPAVAQSKLKIAAQLPMQRMEMAAVIHNVAQDMGWNTDTDPAIGSKIADWDALMCQDEVAYCYANGFLTGTDAAGTFAPYDPMTRAQAATVLCRLLDAKNNNGSTSVPSEPTPTAPPPTTPPQPSAAAVKDMVRVEEQSSGSRIFTIYVDNKTIAGKLSNGKDINEKNINAMIDEILQVFPVGTQWGITERGEDEYWFGGFDVSQGGGCAAFASMTGAVLYGMDAKFVNRHTDLSAVKAGDIVYGYGKGEHWFVVTGTSEDEYMGHMVKMVHGNSGGRVNQSEQPSTNMYPQVTVFSFY